MWVILFEEYLEFLIIILVAFYVPLNYFKH